MEEEGVFGVLLAEILQAVQFVNLKGCSLIVQDVAKRHLVFLEALAKEDWILIVMFVT